jgi:hypothetical protein
MKGYTSIAQIQNYLLTDIAANFQSQVIDWISSIEAYIDQQTGHSFIADSTDSDRKYDGNNKSRLPVDDCVSISKVMIGESEINSADYYKYPANELPIEEILLKSGVFSKGHQNITITGKWGYSSAVPDDIRLVATVLVAGIINFSNDSSGEVQSMNVGRFSVTYKDKTQMSDFDKVGDILASYKKYSF